MALLPSPACLSPPLPPSQEDVQESFFLSETVKYLLLLFDRRAMEGVEGFLLTTEGHPLPPLRYEGGEAPRPTEAETGQGDEGGEGSKDAVAWRLCAPLCAPREEDARAAAAAAPPVEGAGGLPPLILATAGERALLRARRCRACVRAGGRPPQPAARPLGGPSSAPQSAQQEQPAESCPASRGGRSAEDVIAVGCRLVGDRAACGPEPWPAGGGKATPPLHLPAAGGGDVARELAFQILLRAPTEATDVRLTAHWLAPLDGEGLEGGGGAMPPRLIMRGGMETLRPKPRIVPRAMMAPALTKRRRGRRKGRRRDPLRGSVRRGPPRPPRSAAPCTRATPQALASRRRRRRPLPAAPRCPPARRRHPQPRGWPSRNPPTRARRCALACLHGATCWP